MNPMLQDPDCDIHEAIFNPDYNPQLTPAILIPDERDKLLNIEKRLQRRIIGQNHAIATVCSAIKRSSVGFKDPCKPVGCYMLLGTTGAGKTELCRALAEVLYGDKSKLTKLDCSDFMTKRDASKLTGAALGYTGYDSGGQLTNAVKQNPYAVYVWAKLKKLTVKYFKYSFKSWTMAF